MKYRGSKPMESIDDAIDFVKAQSLKKDQTFTIRKAVELVQTKELIGSVMFRFYENQKHTCEIGYF